jgi:ribosomal protein S12 methylthiotransferase accessory factor
MAFWERMGVPPSQARSRLDVTLVSAIAFGEVDIAPLTDLLGRQAVKVAREGDVAVVVTDDYLRPELAAWNARSLISAKPWLLTKPVGMETWIGPMFVPGKTACWECLVQRLRGHRKLEEYVARRTGTDAPVGAISARIASTQHATLAEAATEITRWIGTGGKSTLLDRVVSTSVLTLERTHHRLIRRPQCPSCGSPERINGSRPVRLRRRPKIHTSDGGNRALDQREVLEQLERHLSPITGVVSTLVPGERTGGAHGGRRCLTPTFAADHNFSDMYDDRFFLQEGLRRRSGGK